MNKFMIFLNNIKKFILKLFIILFKKKSIKTKIIYTCLVLLIFSSLVICFFSVTLTINDKKKSLSERMEAICITMQDNISGRIDDILEEVELIAKSNELSEYINYFDDNYITQLFINKSDLFYEISYINTDYKEELKVVNSSEILDYTSFKNDEFFINFVNSEDTDYIFSDEFLIDSIPYIKLFYKIKDEYFDIIGFLSCSIRVSNIIEDVITKKFEEAGFVYIVNKNGKVLNHINQDNIFKDISKDGKKNLNILMSEKEINNNFLRYNMMGIDGWIYYMPYKAMNWLIIATLPYNQFIKSINNFISFYILIITISLILSFIFVNIITNKITKDLILVTDKIEKISEGGILELKRINTKQKKDEVGVLINSFNNMLDSLNYKVDIIRQIADENNLSLNVKTISDQDILGTALSKMITSLNVILTQVNNASVQINLKADQVAHTSQYLSQGATEQASTLEEITSSIAEISNQSKQNFRNAQNGNNQMKDLIAAMKNINKSADEIKKIVKVIDDIAFQTNLLALNANIEAARAGKYGKGFGVVAEEVRNLASRSTIRVKDTTKMVEEAIKNINIGSTLVETTAKQLEEIVFGSKEQTERLDQINNGLSQIEQVTQNNLASAEESASAAEEFASQSELLKSMIMQFKLKDIYQ